MSSSSRENPISPVTDTKPGLTISAVSINSEPVELESIPISPERLRRRNSKSAEEAMSDVSAEERKLRQDLMRERKIDAAVLVDVPETPSADQLEQAATTASETDGTSTADKKSDAR